jgi:methyltransferase
MFVSIFAAVFLPMLVEARRARVNEQAQRARGGVEPRGDLYPLMRAAYPGLFLVMLIEGVWRGAPSLAVELGGAVVFTAAKALKWWAILALGPAWTFRVIVVPGVPLVAAGPYRHLRHPNYVAVLGEFAGVALLTGAKVAGPLALVLFGGLILKRIAVEEKALQTL